MCVRVLTIALVAVVALSASADSLFTPAAAHGGTLITPKRAKFEVGDLITVMVREDVDASTKAKTDTKREATLDGQVGADNQFFTDNGVPSRLLPRWDTDVTNEHKSKGETNRSNTLRTTIACKVTEVLPNEQVRIRGEKRVTVNREDSRVFVEGTIRTEDVTAENTILSTQVADAVVELKGKGPIWNSQRRGILTKILDWISPF